MQTIENEYNEVILNTDIIQYNNIGDNKPQIGINANSFAERFGEKADLVVSLGDDGYYGANYVAFIPMLIKNAQAQEKRIENLEERLAALEEKLDE